MPLRVLAAPAATKAEHGVRSRVLISAGDARALKLSSGDAVSVQDGLVCTVGILNTIKPQTCMLSAEVLDRFPAGTLVVLVPVTELVVCTELRLSPSVQLTPSTLNYLARRWQDCVVSPGTKLGAFMAGSFRVFCVEQVGGGNTIGPHTKVVTWPVDSPDLKAVVPAAGLQVEEARLVELIDTWQLYVAGMAVGVHSKFPPPRSAIVFGPSGCGKTLLGRQVQRRFGSDKVLFWDDADLAEEEDEEEVANRFLLATCSAASVPEQTRKRFDVELEIAPPNAHQRAQILTALLASCPGDAVEDVGKVANRAHGFVGADLNLLVKQASGGGVTLMAALKLVKPSCLREAVVTIPNVRWDDIGGMDEVKQTIRESVELPLKHPQAFERLGIRPPSGILLYGPPGCSKTLLAKAVATESEMNFIAVKGPELLSKWVGDSEKAIQATFRRARMSKPCVVFFDEIDALAVQRSADGGGGVSHRVTSQLLQELDGIEPRNGVIVLCATNRPDLLDVALLRPGRIDRLVYVPPPDLVARLEILKINLAPIPHSFSEELLAGLDTRGFSGAEVASICRNAALLALEQDCSEVSFAHLELVTAKVQPQITSAVLDFYAEFKRRLR